MNSSPFHQDLSNPWLSLEAKVGRTPPSPPSEGSFWTDVLVLAWEGIEEGWERRPLKRHIRAPPTPPSLEGVLTTKASSTRPPPPWPYPVISHPPSLSPMRGQGGASTSSAR